MTIEQIAKDFGIHPMTLQGWLRRADIDAKVRPHGEVDAYLARQLLGWNASNMEPAVDFRSLRYSPAIGATLNPFGAVWKSASLAASRRLAR
ncbi:hypothetical protein [Microbacterium alcoholitolerans]|uniref:hypothetical protein n=1 Tax=unclassified Microbacterium TaxID=2609290 RepID=UPI003D17E4B7